MCSRFMPLACTGGLTGTVVTGLLLLALVYWWALPKPLPGIPYNKHAARRILGDLPEMGKFHKETRLFWQWLTNEVVRLETPIFQVFMVPMQRPHVVVADYQEAHDILVHRHTEFDRADFFEETMGPLTPEGHILFKSDAKFRYHRKVIGDLMSPSFLYNVAAPNLYVGLCKHLELWEHKMRLAEGRPFDAVDDIYYSALDAVTSFTFSDKFEHNATKSRIKFYSELPSIPLPSDKTTPAVFPPSPITDVFVEAIRDLSIVYEGVMASLSPRLAWKFILRRKHVKEAIANKDAVFEREINAAVDRIRSGKLEESRMKSALDRVLLKMASIAEKDGRQPNFHERMVYDEVGCCPWNDNKIRFLRFQPFDSDQRYRF